MLASSGLSGRELEESLIESSRHIAMAIKRDEDIERALTDGLTGLLKKEKFVIDLREAFAATAEGGESLALLMVDIDHFKKVNDTYGHLTGDLILKGVASVLRRKIRNADVAYRYGGEEMAVLLPGADLQAAAATAERVRQAVETTRFFGEKGEHVPITLSVGVAQREVGLQSERELIERADQALYASKDGGRNKVSTWPMPAQRTLSARKSLMSERKAQEGVRSSSRAKAKSKSVKKNAPRRPSDRTAAASTVRRAAERGAGRSSRRAG
jgi:diguanylate cyclase (GGDEF)-like protein